MVGHIGKKTIGKTREGNANPSPQEPTTNGGHCGVKYNFETVGQCQCVVVYQEVIVSMKLPRYY